MHVHAQPDPEPKNGAEERVAAPRHRPHRGGCRDGEEWEEGRIPDAGVLVAGDEQDEEEDRGGEALARRAKPPDHPAPEGDGGGHQQPDAPLQCPEVASHPENGHDERVPDDALVELTHGGLRPDQRALM